MEASSQCKPGPQVPLSTTSTRRSGQNSQRSVNKLRSLFELISPKMSNYYVNDEVVRKVGVTANIMVRGSR